MGHILGTHQIDQHTAHECTFGDRFRRCNAFLLICTKDYTLLQHKFPNPGEINNRLTAA